MPFAERSFRHASCGLLLAWRSLQRRARICPPGSVSRTPIAAGHAGFGVLRRQSGQSAHRKSVSSGDLEEESVYRPFTRWTGTDVEGQRLRSAARRGGSPSRALPRDRGPRARPSDPSPRSAPTPRADSRHTPLRNRGASARAGKRRGSRRRPPPCHRPSGCRAQSPSPCTCGARSPAEWALMAARECRPDRTRRVRAGRMEPGRRRALASPWSPPQGGRPG